MISSLLLAGAIGVLPQSAVQPVPVRNVAIVVFELVLNATSLFNHANLRLPSALDRVLRLIVVTPDMHRVHHSIDRREHDANYGFNLSIWDRLLGTYVAQPKDGHQETSSSEKRP